MYWQYRYVNCPSENMGEDWIEIKEVHFNDDGSLLGYTRACTGSETTEGIKWVAERIMDAAHAAVLHETDFKAVLHKDDFEEGVP